MRVTLISPRIAVQKGDFLGSGVPYWPVELAVLAAYLPSRGDDVSVIDLFGSDPRRLVDRGDYYLQGTPPEELLRTPAVTEADAFILYAISYMSHEDLLGIAALLKRVRPGASVAILENSQAVTAYSIERLSESFFSAGVDGLICGEACFNWDEIRTWLESPRKRRPPDNVISRWRPAGGPVRRRMERLASYPIPAWEKFPVRGYWSLPYSHGPKTGTYLPILASRGCPYPCDFCVVPETNDRRWRERRPVEVVDEIISLRDRFGVRHFQVEDLNPTVRSAYWAEISRLLLERSAKIYFYFVSGTKAETVPLDQVPLLARAGCRYISISPESGSREVMKQIGKPFDYDHGLKLVRACREQGIRTQACFLVGHPAETPETHEESRRYLQEMVRSGLDEVAVFIVAPFAGSDLHTESAIALSDDDALPSFSPRGRDDFSVLQRRRRELIRVFFLEKLKKGLDLWLQGLRAILGRPQTKMENLPRRMLFITSLIRRRRRSERA